ncbi:ABC transporter permease [Algoriphagus jejuensis]|uniref:ABC transporter permease n=1 Tax=Algoriphagus jejuensis TaxID=419934 RepID=A0ABP3YJR8_9BACT
MLKNYLKIAWRSLKKNKLVSGINILGLALGIGTCLVIALYVFDELSYDRYSQNSDRIYRVNLQAKLGDEALNEASVMAPVAETFMSEIAEVEDATRISNVHYNTKLIVNDQEMRKGTTAFVDPNFFDLFTLDFVQGNPKTALTKPNTLVITTDQAKALFGGSDPINQVIRLDEIGRYSGSYVSMGGEYTVTGVVENVPDNSHFHFDMFASMLGNSDATNQSWMSGSYSTYVLLADGVNAEQVQEKIPGLVKKYMEGQMKESLGMGVDEFFAKGNFVHLNLQPLTEIHLSTIFKGAGQFETGGDLNTVLIYCAVALFMLLIACVNFMNLSTAGASQRVKEIGVRKVMGSDKRHLICQFLAESFVAIVLAMVLGLVFCAFALPYFNEFSFKALQLSALLSPFFLISLGVLVVVVTLLAGGYPAFFLSGFKPIDSLKKKVTASRKSSGRNGLVVFQFAISSCLIIATIVVAQQMDYIQNKDLGYQRDQLIVLRHAGLMGKQIDVFKDKLKNDPRVANVSKSAFIPAGPSDSNVQNLFMADSPSNSLRLMQYGIDEEYLETLGMELLQGRNFSLDFGSEENNIILNETAVKELGIEGDPVGKVFEKMTDNKGGREQVKVIGVVKDFVARSLREPIKPLMMVYNPYSSLIIKAHQGDIAGLMADMENTWDGFDTGEPFSYSFLDELYNQTYVQESRMGSFLTLLALLTIFVACLGLFGLVTYTAEQRFKEIGVRKVLGSTSSQIVALLARDFIKPVMLSFLLAFPLGYYFMEKWLQNFAFHIELQWWVFALAGFITLLIALVTICSRSLKAALMNPVESLKSE